ncbi:DUF4442 domain-containing protein [Mycobacteriaceae bacterium NPDC060252]
MSADASRGDGSENVADMVNRLIEVSVPRIGQMGVAALEVRRGYAVAVVPVEGNTNHLGTVYAGVLFTLAEFMGGAIAMGTFDVGKYYPIVKAVEIAYLKPAKTEVRAEVWLDDIIAVEVAEMAAEKGKADFDLVCDLTDGAGVVVATSRACYQIRAYGT